MSETEINKIIANNINMYLELFGKSQVDLAIYMNVSQATVSNWCKGLKMPRMDKIDKICSYFKINRSELLEDNGPINHKNRQQEEALLSYFNKLNDNGKNKAIEYAADLTHNTNYANHLTLIAAHNDHLDLPDETAKIIDDIISLKRP